MPENAKNEEVTPATEAQQEAIQASDELSMDELEALSGGWQNQHMRVGQGTLSANQDYLKYGTQADWGRPLTQDDMGIKNSKSPFPQ